MIASLSLILLCQLAGEVLVRGLGLLANLSLLFVPAGVAIGISESRTPILLAVFMLSS
jgi:putative effector of murein hydrolase LrgA (UPF0299 family)